MTVALSDRERENLRRLVEQARTEDVGPGDVTSELLPPDVSATAQFTAREPLTAAGLAMLADIAAAYDPAIETTLRKTDGQQAAPRDVLAGWTGPARSMLTAERVALNFLQRLSGIATTTARYVEAVSGTQAGIYDTRKTTPGWRDLEKYAVRCGGGRNHRRGLYDAVLVKDNHLAVLARAGQADPIAALESLIAGARKKRDDLQFVQVEVDTLDQLAEALKLPVDIVLLDNMSIPQLNRAIDLRRQAGREEVELEASGGITLRTIRDVAETGVDRISVGALTHSAVAVDIGLDIRI